MNLTPEQRDAACRAGQDVCVVAGPGSGKTRVLIERFRWRVQQGLSPLQLLAVTFTEKAATELRQRLASDFARESRIQEQIERAPVSTLHGFCARLLREHAIEAGVDPQFEVLDEFTSHHALRQAAGAALDRLLENRPAEMRALIEAVEFDDPAQCLIGAYQALRVAVLGIPATGGPGPGGPGSGTPALPDCVAAVEELRRAVEQVVAAAPRGWTPGPQQALEAVQAWGRRLLALPKSPASPAHFQALAGFDCNLNQFRKRDPACDAVREIKQRLLEPARQALATEYFAPQRALLWEALVLLDQLYRERKQALNALDFADLEERAIGLLRDHEPVRTLVRESFEEVLMDELQDTNPLQWMLVDLVRRPDRFFAVGDINQSIFGFRHASPEAFRSYRARLESEGKTIDRLWRNHRSREPILRAAEAIFAGAEGVEPHRLEAFRSFFQKSEPCVEVIAASGATSEEAARLEAQWVARRIRELEGTLLIQHREEGIRPARFRDMAVLMRNINALEPFEQAFRQFGVPCVIVRGKRFYEAPEVNDLVHWLRVLVNPRDEISMAAVLRSPLAGVGDETLMRLKQLGNLADAIACLGHIDTSAFDAGDLERLIAFRDELERMRAASDGVSPDRLLVRAIDRSDYESGLDARAGANVRKLLAQVRGWFAYRPRPLAELVRELELLRAFDPDQPAAPPDDSVDAVRVLTVHSAKGLEFPIVFLTALHKGVSRKIPPLAFSPQAGLVARWRDPAGGDAIKDLPYAASAELLRRKERDEEERLLYVGITRAEEHLVFSFAAAGKPREWAEKLVAGLGLNLEPVDNRPAVETCGNGAVPVRVLRTNSAPEAPETAARWAAKEPLRLARPALSDQHDSTAAVTSVALFENCPRSYYLSRYLGFEAPAARPSGELPEDEDAASEMDASELGRQVHALLAGERVEDAPAEAAELAERFWASDLGRQAATARRAEREFDFLLAVEGMALNGRIDLWFEADGQLVLVDYKTDDVTGEEAAARGQTYALQLRLYALALEAQCGRLPDRALLCWLRPNVVTPVALEASLIEAAKASVRALALAQAQVHFPLREGGHCRRCSFYRGLCPAGR
ncbi:MAG: UvrD-helicase domain-containing protein [Acidobacteriota bacterium]